VEVKGRGKEEPFRRVEEVEEGASDMFKSVSVTDKEESIGHSSFESMLRWSSCKGAAPQ
jgi:hypothetical protein